MMVRPIIVELLLDISACSGLFTLLAALRHCLTPKSYPLLPIAAKVSMYSPGAPPNTLLVGWDSLASYRVTSILHPSSSNTGSGVLFPPFRQRQAKGWGTRLGSASAKETSNGGPTAGGAN